MGSRSMVLRLSILSCSTGYREEEEEEEEEEEREVGGGEGGKKIDQLRHPHITLRHQAFK